MRRGAGHRKVQKDSVPVFQSEPQQGQRWGQSEESVVWVRRCPERGDGRQGLRGREGGGGLGGLSNSRAAVS